MKSLTLEGDALMDEVMVLRSLGHFNRERIPERYLDFILQPKSQAV